MATLLEFERIEIKQRHADSATARIGHGREHVFLNDARARLGTRLPRELGGLLTHACLKLLRFSEDLVLLQRRLLDLSDHRGGVLVGLELSEQGRAFSLALGLCEARAAGDAVAMLEQ